MEVSIPHRYGITDIKFYTEDYKTFYTDEKSQFLIGTVLREKKR